MVDEENTRVGILIIQLLVVSSIASLERLCRLHDYALLHINVYKMQHIVTGRNNRVIYKSFSIDALLFGVFLIHIANSDDFMCKRDGLAIIVWIIYSLLQVEKSDVIPV